MEISKRQFENRSGGYIGAVVIGAKGEETGIPVEPGGSVWLSEAEQILTANAPRRPEHNPFIAQMRTFTNPETGELVTQEVTPLVPISEERYVPASERPIPGLVTSQAAAVAATGDEPYVPVAMEGSAEEREKEVLESMEMPKAPARAAASVQSQEQPTMPDVSETTATAQASDKFVAEETGAAVPPVGAAPTGEYAAGEEVGTPDAPASEDDEQPAPWQPEE